MANGPLGGFMPTPPSPGQPPQVKLETSAESRGAFNKFLGTLPRNGAVAPIQTGVVPSSTAPVSPIAGNVNIFQPQMSQMTAMPMMPPVQPVQMMQFGGEAEESIVGDDPDAGFDFDDDTGSFDVAEQPDVTQDEQQQNIEDSQTFMDTPISSSVVDTRPVTNIRNVGPTSNLRFDPQFAANIAQSRGIDPSVSLRPADFAQTTQGGATAPTLTSGLPSFGTGADFLRERELDRLRPSNVNQIAPVSRTVGTGVTTTPNELDLLGLGGLGVDLSSPKSRDVLDNQFTQLASLGGLRGQIDRLGSPGLTGTALTTGLPSIDTVADDLVRGRGLGENINNPGNIRAGGGFDGEIGKTKDGFAIFDSMQSGVDAINKLSNTYGSKRNINTVREFANRYSPVGENTAKEVSNKINFLSNALGVGPDEKVDFTDPNVQAKFTPALITSEIGRDRAQNVANVLSGFSPSSLNVTTRDLNPNITSNVDQLGSLDPIARVEPETVASVSPTTENITATSRGDVPIDPFAIQSTFQNFGLPGVNLPNVGSTRSTVQQDQARALRNLVGQRQLTPGELLQQNILADRGRALGPVTFGRDLENFAERVEPAELSRVGDDFDPALNIVDRREQAQRVQELLNRGQLAERDKMVQEMEAIDREPDPIDTTNITETALGGRGAEIVDQELSPIVAAGIGAPKEFRQPFPDAGIKIGNFTIPTLTSGLNLISDFSRQRVFDAVLNKGATPVYDGDVLVGAKINGVLVEGMDPNAPIDSGDNEDPITKFIKKATEDKKEEEEKEPNVIGGTTTTETLENLPTVVPSTARKSTANITPVGFDSGNLNDLIARITGVPAPRRMQEGGTVAAVDRFLSKVA